MPTVSLRTALVKAFCNAGLWVLLALATLGTPSSGSARERISETKLADLYESKIVEFWNRQGERRDFLGTHGVRIAAMAFPNPNRKDGIVIANGYGESFIKYRELVYDLWHEGYQVYLLDHRGQGLSDRLLPSSRSPSTDPQVAKHVHDLGYVDKFDNFVADLKTFVEEEAKRENERLFLLAHSMGGAIASLYLEQFGHDFVAAALTAPMHQPDLSPLPNQTCWLLKLAPGKSYVWGRGPYISRAFDADRDLTGSRTRYDILKRGELDRYPQAQLGGPSFHWAYEACKAAKRSIGDANRIKIDVLLFQAEDDRVVKARGQQRFCENLNSARPGSCLLRKVRGARHELLIEADVHRELVLQEILSFFKQH